MAELINTTLYNSANLLAYYQLQNNSTDSKNDYDGSDSNMSYTAAKYDNGGSFNGSSSYITIGTPAGLSLPTTVSLVSWIYADVNNTTQSIIHDATGAAAHGQYAMTLNSQKLRMIWGNGATSAVFESDSNVITSTGTWYHIAATRDSSRNVKLYVNGLEVAGSFTAGSNATTAYASLQGLSIGRYGAYSADYFDGLIDDIAIFDKVLSLDEIQELYDTDASSTSSTSSSSSMESSTSLSSNSSSSTTLSSQSSIGTSSSSSNTTYSSQSSVGTSSSSSSSMESSTSLSSSSSTTLSSQSSVSENSSSSSITLSSQSSSSTTLSSQSSLGTSSTSSTSSSSPTSQSESSHSSSSLSSIGTSSSSSDISSSSESTESESSNHTSSSSSSTSNSSSSSSTTLSSQSSIGTSSSSTSSTSSVGYSSSSSSSSSSTSSSSSSSNLDRLAVGWIIDRIRLLVNDVSETRFTDAHILLWINDGLIKIRSKRPDTRINSLGNRRTYTKLTNRSYILDLEDVWRTAIVNYSCYRLLSESSENKVSIQRSEIYKKLFYDKIIK